MNNKFFTLKLMAFSMLLFFASVCLSEETTIRGTLIDAMDKSGLHDGKITTIQKERTIENSTTANGNFELQLNEGPVEIIYQAPGYAQLKDAFIVNKANNRTIIKKIRKDSVDGWLTILLLIPGVFGLFVAWFKESIDRRKGTANSTQGRMWVAVVNGIVWAVVLAWVWFKASMMYGVTEIQFFNSSLAFEFFVPFLGYLGSLLFVFDLFRGKDDDSFKDKEFGMRIIMGPYVAIIVVALFGKEFDIINLDSVSGQGALAFISGLLVVVVIQGIIERANEMLGNWRRRNNPYVASPLAKKFDLSEDEDQVFVKVGLRHPEQLLMLTIDDLEGKMNPENFDIKTVMSMKHQLDSEQLHTEISDLVWNRLKPENVSTIQDFATLSAEKLEQIANEKPELCPDRIKNLQGKTIKFLDGNGSASISPYNFVNRISPV